jgi:hypothetical protein
MVAMNGGRLRGPWPTANGHFRGARGHGSPAGLLLVNNDCGRMLANVNGKWSKWLPYVFILVAALSRWPKLFPPNFSAFYGLAFCAGAFFPRNIKWWLPLGTLVVTDLTLDLFYYHSISVMQMVNYVAYALIILLGTRFNHRSRFLGLLAGGIVGAILFYFLTNTAAWLFNPFGNPEYTKDLAGWLIALTKGTGGYPTTLQFFLNTLLSGGLFTGIFAGALKLSEAAESAREKEAEEEPAEAPESEEAPEEGKA